MSVVIFIGSHEAGGNLHRLTQVLAFLAIIELAFDPDKTDR